MRAEIISIGTEILLARPPHVLLAARTCGSSCWTVILRLRPILRRHGLLRGARRWLRVDRKQTTRSGRHAHSSGGVCGLITLSRSIPVRGLFKSPHTSVGGGTTDVPSCGARRLEAEGGNRDIFDFLLHPLRTG